MLPVEVGAQQMIFQGDADLGVKVEARGSVMVEEQGELTFTIDQDADPIELSASTTYTVEVRNVGRPDRNVELSLQLPPGSEVLKVDAPVQARVEGDQLRFDPIPQMDGRTSQKFRVEVRHGKVGTQKVSAQLRSQIDPRWSSKKRRPRFTTIAIKLASRKTLVLDAQAVSGPREETRLKNKTAERRDADPVSISARSLYLVPAIEMLFRSSNTECDHAVAFGLAHLFFIFGLNCHPVRPGAANHARRTTAIHLRSATWRRAPSVWQYPN